MGGTGGDWRKLCSPQQDYENWKRVLTIIVCRPKAQLTSYDAPRFMIVKPGVAKAISF